MEKKKFGVKIRTKNWKDHTEGLETKRWNGRRQEERKRNEKTEAEKEPEVRKGRKEEEKEERITDKDSKALVFSPSCSLETRPAPRR